MDPNLLKASIWVGGFIVIFLALLIWDKLSDN